MKTIALLIGLSTAFTLQAQERASDSRTRTIESVLAHPLFKGMYVCSEHFAGQLESVGDDLGQDCLPAKFDKNAGFPKLYENAGTENSDWVGWNQPVLAPCDCTVKMARMNETVNKPGATGKPPASFILLTRADGVFFVLAHVQAPMVKAGDQIKAGQVIAKVGNNGFGRMPHIHIGAWKGKDALQLRWDQQKISE